MPPRYAPADREGRFFDFHGTPQRTLIDIYHCAIARRSGGEQRPAEVTAMLALTEELIEIVRHALPARAYMSEKSSRAADRYAALPLELRMAALCLPMPENLARAA